MSKIERGYDVVDGGIVAITVSKTEVDDQGESRLVDSQGDGYSWIELVALGGGSASNGANKVYEAIEDNMSFDKSPVEIFNDAMNLTYSKKPLEEEIERLLYPEEFPLIN